MWRITPADAGTSSSRTFRLRPLRDHPRGCGDKWTFLQAPESPRGSPPRMRGQVRLQLLQMYHRWITPADAGTSLNCTTSKTKTWDHPRGCGDKHSVPIRFDYAVGSPPRMRGQGTRLSFEPCSIRITPADAGTSKTCTDVFRKSADHPRGCGDKHKIP